jgi:hypothetical protein
MLKYLTPSVKIKISVDVDSRQFKSRAWKNPGFIEKACRQVNCRFFRQNRFLKTGFSPKMFNYGGQDQLQRNCKEKLTLKFC